MVIDWHLFPVISGLMVTTVRERHRLAMAAVNDFTGQHWLHKELLIVNTTGLRFPKREGVVELVPGDMERLWEQGLACCHGEWVADWQDDCRYSPRYLHAMARLRSRGKRVSLLAYRGWCLQDGTVVNVDNDGAAFSLAFRFTAVSKGTPIWLDKRELVTRYYASKAAA